MLEHFPDQGKPVSGGEKIVPPQSVANATDRREGSRLTAISNFATGFALYLKLISLTKTCGTIPVAYRA